MSSLSPAKTMSPAATGGGELFGCDGVGLLGIGSSDDDEDDLGMRLAEAFGCRKELAETLLPDETRHHPHHDGVCVDAEIGPGLSATVLVRSGTEALQVDAVSEQHELVTRHAQAGQTPQGPRGSGPTRLPSTARRRVRGRTPGPFAQRDPPGWHRGRARC